MRWIFMLMCCISAGLLKAQDLTGIWRGSFVSADSRLADMFNLEDRYKYEVQIDQRGKEFTGVTYSYKTTMFYGKASSNGTVNPKTGKVMLQELKLLELKMASNSYACWMICFLQYTKNGDEEFLEGKYSSYRESDSSACGRGSVFLRKVVTSDFYKEPFLAKTGKEKKEAEKPIAKASPSKTITTKAPPVKTPSVAKAPASSATSAKKPVTQHNEIAKNKPSRPSTSASVVTDNDVKTDSHMPSADPAAKTSLSKLKESNIIPPVLKNRENELVQALTVNTNEVTVNIYDNGTIDHDTISVYLDKKLVINHQMLTTNAITLKLKLDESNDFHELVMVADNLGDIPPNTSLMVVKAGDKQYEVRIASTEQKNAVVTFKYEKPR